MDRRDFLRTAGAGAMAAFFSPHAAARSSAKSPKNPNIVFILADDLGYGDLSCLNNQSKIQTPNIDKIASSGVVFTDAHSGSAVCSPTRYGIMTGRYSWRTKLQSGVLWVPSPPLIDPKRLTVASLLKSRGYRTACIGKWHLGLGWQTTDGKPARVQNINYRKPITDGPCSRGFDYYFGIPASLDMEPYVYIENNCVLKAPTARTDGGKGPQYFRPGPMAPGFKHEEVLPRLTDKAVNCIDRHARRHPDKPLFLYFPLSAPHAPVMPAREFQGRSELGVYGDFVSEVDWTVGRVMEALARNGIADNTLLIFTSDNGFSPVAGLKEISEKGHAPSYHFRGYKADIWDGGHHIPFVARWPGKIAASSSGTDTVWLGDLMATAAAIVGETLPDNAGEDSVSMLPALLGQTPRPIREATIHHSSDGAFAIRQGNWKLEFCAGSGGWSAPKPANVAQLNLPPVQLYDMNNDVGEKKNLEAEHPEVVARLTKLMEKYIADGRSTPGAPQQNDCEIVLRKPM